MIYTVTTSPSLDLIMDLKGSLKAGGAFRAAAEEIRPGGKGINISIMLNHLGISSTALGFVAGFSGDELMRLTAASGIKTGFIRVRRGRTRINLRLKDETSETRVNGLGPAVTAQDIEYLLRKIKDLSDEDFLVLAGIIPPTLPSDIFTSYFEALGHKHTKVIIDTTPEIIFTVLKYEPFLVKPDILELAAYLKVDLKDETEIKKTLCYLKDQGARNVMLSKGSAGTYFIDEEGVITFIKVPDESRHLDRTGAGDSMIAGFLYDYLARGDLKSAAYMAVAAGTATATSIGIAKAAEVQKLRDLMGA